MDTVGPVPRRRLGVVLTVPPPLAGEVDGLRRAGGDPMLGRVAPHVTLVPPVNVREADLPAALARLRRAAAILGRPLVLDVGPAATFHPVTPVLYLAVGGPEQEVGALHRLRDAVFEPPLARSLTHPFHPHVTLGEDLDERRLQAALVALDRYRARATFTRVHLLEEHRDADGVRRWRPLADAALEPPVMVGTGGLAVELSTVEIPDPEVVVATTPIGRPGPLGGLAAPAIVGVPPVVVVARRDQMVLGAVRADVVTGPLGRRCGVLTWLGVGSDHRREGVARHLVDRLEQALIGRGADAVSTPGEAVPGPVRRVLRSRGWTGSGGLEKNLLIPV